MFTTLNRSAIFALLLLGVTSFEDALACTNFFGQQIRSVLELPKFQSTVEGIMSARDSYLEQLEEQLSNLISLDPTTVQTFDESPIAVLERLVTFSGMEYNPISFLDDTSDEEEIRLAATDAATTMQTWYREHITFNIEIFQLLMEFADTDFARALSGERRLLLDTWIGQYEKEGLALNEIDRDMLELWKGHISDLKSEINRNINTDDGIVEFTKEELDGLTEFHLNLFEYNNATQKYMVMTRSGQQFVLVAQYANNPETRRLNSMARNLRNYDRNAGLIHELISLRQSTAELLGYSNWADLANSDRLIGSGQAAYEFLQNLDDGFNDAFLEEQAELSAIKSAMGQEPTVHEYDVRYLQNIRSQQEFELDAGEVQEYFEEESTIRGIFDLFEGLFGINITVMDVPKEESWTDDDIRLAVISEEVNDGSSTYQNELGAVYLDLHSRPGKSGGYYLSPIWSGHVREEDGLYQAPVGAIVGNWPRATPDRPSLWSTGNVNTMMHEFGHALHHVFSCTEFVTFAGTRVPRDFVEAPSQMLERWLEDTNVVKGLSKHFETGEPMPDELLEKLSASRNSLPGHSQKYGNGLSFGDLQIYSYTSADEIPSDGYGIYQEADEILGDTYYPQLANASIFASFPHILAYSYDAGYYSYAHSDAIAADLATQFRDAENGFFDKDVAARYRKEILSVGSSRDETESIRSFLGRDWTVDAYIAEQLGSNTNANSTSPPSSPLNDSPPVVEGDNDNGNQSNDPDPTPAPVSTNTSDETNESSKSNGVVSVVVGAVVGGLVGGVIGLAVYFFQKRTSIKPAGDSIEPVEDTRTRSDSHKNDVADVNDDVEAQESPQIP